MIKPGGERVKVPYLSSSLVGTQHRRAYLNLIIMRTNKRKNPNLAELRSLKIQPRHRFNRWSTTIVPELKLCGQWLEKLGFEIDSRVTIHASKEHIIIRPQEERK